MQTKIPLLLFTLFYLAGCSDAVPIGKMEVSGTILIVEDIVFDSDTNDRNAPYADNNDPARAQAISNKSTIIGFASAHSTIESTGLDRFTKTTDPYDYYRTFLMAGQSVKLNVINANNENDLDLFVFNTKNDAVAGSTNTGIEGQHESINIEQSDEYIILIRADSGKSSYILSFSDTHDATNHNVASNFIEGQAVVQYRPNPEARDIRTLASSSRPLPTKVIFNKRDSLPIAAQIPPSKLEKYNSSWQKKLDTLIEIKHLNQSDDVEFAEPNYIRNVLKLANDTHFHHQQNLQQINLPKAWDITTGYNLSDVTVAMIDTGVFINHEDLSNKLVTGVDFISDTSNRGNSDGSGGDPGIGSGDSQWHGTHVAGIIAAQSNNNLGITGVSWGAKIMPLRVAGHLGATSYDIAQAIYYAAGLPNSSNSLPTKAADIINLSIGAEARSSVEEQAIIKATNRGIIMVAASGNDGKRKAYYPAAYSNVIAVSATDSSHSLASYSNYGNYIDLAAPGGDESQGILSTFVELENNIKKSSYAYLTGTSMAVPHITGVIALMKDIYPNLSLSQLQAGIKNCLITNRKNDCYFDEKLGYGEIDALLALEFAQNPDSLPVDYDYPLIIEPSHLLLKTFGSSTITLKNTTSNIIENLEVKISEEAGWLSIDNSPSYISELTEVNFQVYVDASRLAAQKYNNTISINYTVLDNRHSLEIPIVLDLTPLPESQPNSFYVQLKNSSCSKSSQCIWQLNSQGNQYKFLSLPEGDYQITASSDLDADGQLCTPGELCSKTIPFQLYEHLGNKKINLHLLLQYP